MTLHRLSRYSAAMAVLTLFLIAAMLVLNAVCWIFPGWSQEYGLTLSLNAPGATHGMKVDLALMPWWQLFGGLLLSSIPLLILAQGLAALRRLFLLYAQKEYFSAQTAMFLGCVGRKVAQWVVASFLIQPLLTVWLTCLQPVGHRVIALSVGSPDFVSLFLAASVMVVARIQREASVLASENQQFI